MKIHGIQSYVHQGLGWESFCDTLICGSAFHQINTQKKLCHRSFPNPILAVRKIFFHVSSYVSLIHQNMMLDKLESSLLGGFWLSFGGEITKLSYIH